MTCSYQSKSTVFGAKSHLLPSLTSPSRHGGQFRRVPRKELIMKLFGTVQSFDTIKGHGEIKPEVGSDLIRFEKSAITWGKDRLPTVGQRLSYEAGTNHNVACALNLQTV